MSKAFAHYITVNYRESDNLFAASKLLAEWFAADAPRAYGLRVEIDMPTWQDALTRYLEKVRSELAH